jgi:hypothetical protein
MELLNVDTNLDIVLSDIYVGMHMLARSQQEERERAIQLATEQVQASINDSTERMMSSTEGETTSTSTSIATHDDESYKQFLTFLASSPSQSHQLQNKQHSSKLRKKKSIFVLGQREDKCQVSERDLLLESNEEDKVIIQDLIHYSKYAQIIYNRLRLFATENGWIVNEEMKFARASETIFESKYLLSGLDCDHAMLWLSVGSGLPQYSFSASFGALTKLDTALESWE